MEPDRRSLLRSAGWLGIIGLGGCGTESAAQAGGSRRFTPEMFGARGDGVTNDTGALAALAAAVNANGGGIIDFRPVTYLVGQQDRVSRGDGPSFRPRPILEFSGCRGPLELRGNGARLRCAPGLRYGIFHIPTGRPRRTSMPYIGSGGATPYNCMIRVAQCTGRVQISGFELDGNADALQLGGQYGDTGWQIPATGIGLFDNRGPELISDVHSHHHAQDGLLIDGVNDGPLPERRITRVRAEYNGRQGCSIVGGRGYVFEECGFNHTGRSRVSSAPGAGVDIEAEGGKRIRDLRFVACQFSDNSGAGMVADSGDSEGAVFERCSFIGTTNWSAWPNKPRFRFRDCSFVGAMARAFGDADAAHAAQFADCKFHDDPALSPNGQVYGGTNPSRPLADLAEAENVLFNRCAFIATHDAVMPWSTRAIYADCRMEQRSSKQAFPRGRFLGRNIINAVVDLSGSRMSGDVIVNGRRWS